MMYDMEEPAWLGFSLKMHNLGVFVFAFSVKLSFFKKDQIWLWVFMGFYRYYLVSSVQCRHKMNKAKLADP